MSEGSWDDQGRRQFGHGVVALSQEADNATTAMAPSVPVMASRAIAIDAPPNKRHGVSCVRGDIHSNDNDDDNNNDGTNASNHQTPSGTDDHHHHSSSSQIFRFEPDDGDGGIQDYNRSRTRASNRVFRVRTIEWVGLQREGMMLSNTSTSQEIPHDVDGDVAAAGIDDDEKGARSRPRQVHDDEGSDYDADDERATA